VETRDWDCVVGFSLKIFWGTHGEDEGGNPRRGDRRPCGCFRHHRAGSDRRALRSYSLSDGLAARRQMRRRLDGPAEPSSPEHGLHVWAGFYDNAFDLLQRCYGATTSPPYADWRDAFVPVDNFWVEESLLGALEPWRLHVPPNGRTPGIGSVQSPGQLWTSLLTSVANAYFASPLRGAGARRAREAGLTARPAASERLLSARRRLEAGGFGLEARERGLFRRLFNAPREASSTPPFSSTSDWRSSSESWTAAPCGKASIFLTARNGSTGWALMGHRRSPSDRRL
jgi:hypothetical protein